MSALQHNKQKLDDHTIKLAQSYMADWSNERILTFRKTLLDWYDANHRHLPWRETKNPYYIWISEIMLQQTQVATVIEYYKRFTQTLPRIEDLATVEDDTLMNLWQGLGYYSRARNLKLAAQQIVNDFDGKMPETMEGLRSLKGIGPYTAAAIGSICFDLVEPAIDGNLFRIIARLFEIKEDIMLPKTRRLFEAILLRLIDPKRPGDFNQALMDMGATIMTASNDRPEYHPLVEFDKSYYHHTSHLYPVKKKKPKPTHHHYYAYAIMSANGDFWLNLHKEGQLLQDLWHFPMIDVTDMMIGELKPSPSKLLFNWLFEHNSNNALHVAESNLLVDEEQRQHIKHIFSHRIWEVDVVRVYLLNNDLNKELEHLGFKRVSRADYEKYPVSTLQNKMNTAIEQYKGDQYAINVPLF